MNAILAVLTLAPLSLLTIMFLYESAIYPALVFAILASVIASAIGGV